MVVTTDSCTDKVLWLSCPEEVLVPAGFFFASNPDVARVITLAAEPNVAGHFPSSNVGSTPPQPWFPLPTQPQKPCTESFLLQRLTHHDDPLT